MRVLKIIDSKDSGGILTCETQFIKYWQEAGVKVDGIIIGNEKSMDVYREILNNYFLFPESYKDFGGSLTEAIRNQFSNKTLTNTILEKFNLGEEYSALIFRRQYFMELSGKLSRYLGCRAYWHMPDSVNRLIAKAYYNYSIKKYKIIPIANSSHTGKTLNNNENYIVYPGYSKERVKKVNKNYRDELNIPFDAHIFGMASRIVHDKAQDLFLKGLIKSGLLEKNVHFILAGGPLDSEFSIKCANLVEDYSSKIHFLGYIDNLNKFYSSIDVYVNSRRNAEPFGISIAEALGAGIPVLTYYKGGPEEMIIDGNNGWIIYDPTIEGYKNGVVKAYSDRIKWHYLGKTAKNSSVKFEARYNANKFLKILKGEI